MKMRFPIKVLGLSLLFLLLAGGGGLVYHLGKRVQAIRQEKKALLAQLQEANEAQKQAVITRRVSSQLEEIAYQQKEISDKQKLEAERQTELAEQLRDHAELEREKAYNAQQAALEAYDRMEEQKQLADHRREEAVAARMKADSLGRLALGRSLGVQASKQFEAGNRPLAMLLCYAAWRFTSENHGDLFQPAIFKALSQGSGLTQQWQIHQSAIRSLITYHTEQADYLFSASQYGEINRWVMREERLSDPLTLFSDVKYDFRQFCADDTHRHLYVLSYTGDIVELQANMRSAEIHPIAVNEPIGMQWIDGHLIIVQRDGSLLRVATDTWKAHAFYRHPTRITAMTLEGEQLLIGDVEGGIYRVSTQGKATLLWQERRQPVTALCLHPANDALAIGYKNGVVMVVDTYGCQRIQQMERISPEDGLLLGMEQISPVSCLVFDKESLYSGSLDGTIYLWRWRQQERATASLVYEGNSWVHTFVLGFDDQSLLVGDENGSLSRAAIDPQQMAEEVYKQLERNFTPAEWNFYIGEVSAYETYK